VGGESFGIVLLEAMAAGAAVLGGDNPGYRSVLESKPELLTPPHDTQALASKLEHYLTDAQDRRRVQAWGQAYAKQFDTAVVGEQLLEIYARALRKRRDVQ
jgi:phosphatidylinositol alpha-mannosyltransferase